MNTIPCYGLKREAQEVMKKEELEQYVREAQEFLDAQELSGMVVMNDLSEL
ncbi:hypothetical protein [Megasphaera sp.]|uniref:hypothetical protein n=1 Tax=Megasphaera sp. TaxID=2023260 RepID=UPI00351F91B6